MNRAVKVLQEHMDQKNLRQADVARILQCSQTQLSRWMTGKTVPRRAWRMAFQNAFGLPLELWDEKVEAVSEGGSGEGTESSTAE